MKRKWTVVLEVDDVWIADGFDLTSERAREMLAADLSYASESELGATVIAAPPAEVIKGLQDGSIPVES